MTSLRDVLAGLRDRLPIGRRDRLADEMREHLDLLAEDYRRRGLPPEEAAAAARRAFGGKAQIVDAYRDAGRFAWLAHLGRDIRHGIRALRRNAGFTIVAVATLALGIGANAAIFTLVNALLFRPLPVAHADRLTVFGRARSDGDVTTTFSFAEFAALRTTAPAWSGVVAVRPAVLGLTADNRADRITVSFVSENYFDVLGVRPSIGGLFRTTDPSSLTAEPALVLSDNFWRRRFNADPAVVGKPVSLGGSPVTIVGVGPRGFTGDSVFQDVAGFLPLHAAGFPMMARTALRVLGPLAAGTTLDSANASLANLSASFANARHEPPDQVRLTAYWERYARPNPHTIRGEVEMTVFFGLLAALVLLLAAVNVANLVLARTIARRPELALRSALGAPAGRLALHLLVETSLLIIMAGGFGLAIGQWATLGVAGLATSLLRPFASHLGFGLDWRVAVFAVATVGVTTLVVGVVPAVGAARRRAPRTVRDESDDDVAADTPEERAHGRSSGGRARPARHRGALRSQPLRDADASVRVRRPQRLRLQPESRRVRVPQSTRRRRAREHPGARGVSSRRHGCGHFAIGPDDRAVLDDRGNDRCVRGRVALGRRDRIRVRVAVVFRHASHPSARRPRVHVNGHRQFHSRRGHHRGHGRTFWPDAGSPIGRTFQFAGSSTGPVQIVGVIGDVKNYGAMQDHESPFFYLPIAQHPTPQVTLQVRSTMKAATIVPAVNAIIHAVAPDVIPYDVETMAETIEKAPDGLFLFRLGADLAEGLGLIGLALAVVGVFGVVAYHARQRTREMALRMALGATVNDVRRDVLRGGGRIVAAGLLAGLIVALAVAALTQDLYVGIDAADPLTFIGAILVVSIPALVACDVPARRAMCADLNTVLRAE